MQIKQSVRNLLLFQDCDKILEAAMSLQYVEIRERASEYCSPLLLNVNLALKTATAILAHSWKLLLNIYKVSGSLKAVA